VANLVGQTLLGRYRIEEAIGRGGMAEVYKAWDDQRNYHVAIKVLREDLAEDREFDRRFRREAEALARLSHKNIVRFYGFEREGYLVFIVMDYVEGTTLRRRIFNADGPLSADKVLSVVEQVVSALHYAHVQGVLHRDVKPGNIMIQPDGRVLVADFGIAKAADAATMTTVMPGTPAYMSPEQCRSELLDVRTDVYSLGVVVYEMLAGRRPFVGESEEAGTGSTGERIRREQMHTSPPLLRRVNPAVSPLVETVVLRALAKEPEARFATVIEFWEAFHAALGLAIARREAPEAKVRVAAPAPPAPVPEPAQPPPPMVPVAEKPAPVGVPAPPQPSRLPAAQPPLAAAPTFLAGLRRLPAWTCVMVLLVVVGGVVALLAAGAGLGELLASRPSLGDTWTRPADGMVMVYVPAGEFEMGSTQGASDEQPVHTVALDGFWIDRTEVTNAQLAAFLNERDNQTEGGVTWLDLEDENCMIERVGGKHRPQSGYADHPVIEVSWYGAKAYCEWAGGRLPTEAEWEHAARGPDGHTYPWGSDAPTCERAQFRECSGRTVPVGSRPGGASWCGALDMAGNVWEWVNDWYDSDYYGRSPSRNPAGPSSGERRVLRGGSWEVYLTSSIRSANRYRVIPRVTERNFGFRCARDSDD